LTTSKAGGENTHGVRDFSPASAYTSLVPAATVFIVDDDALLRLSLRDRFSREGYDLVEAGSCAEATARLTPEVDLVLLDFQVPDGDGLSVLRYIKEKSPDTIVILMTAYSSVPNAVEAMKLGAFHYVNKPFDVDEIVLLAEKALETTRLRREVRALRGSQQRDHSFDAIIGNSPAMQNVKSLPRVWRPARHRRYC
jgi:DNA-binding NtrC family response regulator